MVLENVWLAEMSKVTGAGRATERKLTLAALIRLVAEAPQMLEAYAPFA